MTMVFSKIREIWNKGRRYDEVVEQLRGEKKELKKANERLKSKINTLESSLEDMETDLQASRAEYRALRHAVSNMLMDEELERLEEYKTKDD